MNQDYNNIVKSILAMKKPHAKKTMFFEWRALLRTQNMGFDDETFAKDCKMGKPMNKKYPPGRKIKKITTACDDGVIANIQPLTDTILVD